MASQPLRRTPRHDARDVSRPGQAGVCGVVRGAAVHLMFYSARARRGEAAAGRHHVRGEGGERTIYLSTYSRASRDAPSTAAASPREGGAAARRPQKKTKNKIQT
eukprot:6196187-Pleurochrysis_carterae.AAC.1